MQRKLNHPIIPSRVKKMTLAVLITKSMRTSHQATNQLRDLIRIFQPETVLRWHRELVRRKWSFIHKSQGDRPRINQEVEELIIRLAQENQRWGYGKIQGELVKLSFKVSQPTVRNILNHQGIDQQIPIPSAVSPEGTIQCRNILGGIIHNYYRAPTHTALSTT